MDYIHFHLKILHTLQNFIDSLCHDICEYEREWLSVSVCVSSMIYQSYSL